MYSGASMVIREKFSASSFWKDIQDYQCTAMIHIGELWRYLYNQPVRPEEKNNPLRVIMGACSVCLSPPRLWPCCDVTF